MTDESDGDEMDDSAPAGPGAIAARQAETGANASGLASGPLPYASGPSTTYAGSPVVGTPGMTDSANPVPESIPASGMSGGATNDLAPGGGRVDNDDRGRAPPGVQSGVAASGSKAGSSG
jgi:hypothetical protein